MKDDHKMQSFEKQNKTFELMKLRASFSVRPTSHLMQARTFCGTYTYIGAWNRQPTVVDMNRLNTGRTSTKTGLNTKTCMSTTSYIWNHRIRRAFYV